MTTEWRAGEGSEVPVSPSPPPETQPESVLRLRRIRVQIVLIETNDELFRLEAEAVVQKLSVAGS